MVIAHNMMAMNAQRQYNIVTNTKRKSTEKLSSGYKINRAADDAAGLSISEKMRHQIRGLNQGSENIQDGVSATQIMDGALNEVQDMLHRMTELSIQASNGTLSSSDRYAIECEIKQLRSEINRISNSTTFNEHHLLNIGDIGSIEQTPIEGVKSGNTDIVFLIDTTGSMGGYITNVVNNLSTFASGLSACNVQYGVVEYGDIADGDAIIRPLTNSTTTLSDTIKNIAITNGGDANESSLEAIMDASKYAFRDDATKEFILVTDAPYHDKNIDNSSTYTNEDVKQKLAEKGIRLSVVTSPGCMELYKNNLANGQVLNMEDNFSESLKGLVQSIAENAAPKQEEPKQTFFDHNLRIQMSSNSSDCFILHTYDTTSKSLGLDDVSCLTQEDAEKAIDLVSQASEKVSAIRSSIGAEQNALEYAARTRDNVAENTTDAESRIRDTDMAEEMFSFSLQSILEQAGQSMMAQANQSNQSVLNLLK